MIPGVAGWTVPAAGGWRTLGAALAIAALAACGARSLSVGSIPFPAGRPVLIGPDGLPTGDLPSGPEPLVLVFLDFPWCPPCAEAWKAVGDASGRIPPGSLRAVRILFDRERFLGPGGTETAPPLRLSAVPAMQAGLPVTTLPAISEAFRDRFRVEQAPLLLLIGPGGRLEKRWAGYTPSLADDIVSSVTLRTGNPPLPGK